jgi:peptidyl-prolyl cis-trans isomerase C
MKPSLAMRTNSRVLCELTCAFALLLLQEASAATSGSSDEGYAARRLAAKPWYVRNIKVPQIGLTLPFSYVTAAILLFSVLWLASVLFGGSKRRDAYVEASHILVTDLANGKKVLEDIKGEIGNSFEAFAKSASKVSTCPSRKQGGNLGRFPPGVMAPTFDRLCFDPASPVHTTLGPIQSPFGYHLVYIHERKLP